MAASVLFDGAIFDPSIFDTGVAAPKWQGRLSRRRILVRTIGQRREDLTDDEAIALATQLGMDPAALIALLAAAEETSA